MNSCGHKINNKNIETLADQLSQGRVENISRYLFPGKS